MISDTAIPPEPDPPADPCFITIVARLRDTYGECASRSSGPPLDELIVTILSQHTSDVNTARAYASLRRAFPDWSKVITAPTADVAAAMRGGGLAAIKAPRIQAVLRAVEAETGELSLEWLASEPMDEARAWLTALPGVGPKTAACVLLFSLGLPAMPVDTHVHRVSRRLGLLDQRVPPSLAHHHLERMTGPDRDVIHSLHLELIAHGRAVCRSRNPACHRSILSDLCSSTPRTEPALGRPAESECSADPD